MDENRFSELVGQIYDAALDEILWIDVLHGLTEYGEGCGASIFSKDAALRTADVDRSIGIPPEFRQSYLETYISFDPATTVHYLSEICEPVATTDFISADEFANGRFYREWVHPQGLVDFVTCALDKTSTTVSMFGIFRHQRNGICDDRLRQRMRLIAPHMRRAVLIGRVMDRSRARAAALADALDHVTAAMFLVGARGEIVHANASGLAAISSGDCLHAPEGRLAARDVSAHTALRQAIAQAAEGDTGLGVGGVAIQLVPAGGTRRLASVLSLASGARRRAGASYAAVAAVFVQDEGDVSKPAPELIARTYRLTPAELRIMLAIVEVGGVPEVAEALGIGEGTVRTHLKAIFAKTGARRQADLVKLVSRYAAGRTEA